MAWPSLTRQSVGLVLFACLPAYAVSLVALYLLQISGYLLAFIALILGFGIMFACAHIGKKSDHQLHTLSNLVEAMIDGDFSLRGRPQDTPGAQALLSQINTLSERLQTKTLAVQQGEQLLEIIMSNMEALMLVVSADGKVVLFNPAASQQLGFSTNDNPELHELELEGLLEVQSSGVIQVQVSGTSSEYFVHRDAFLFKDDMHSLYLLTRADRLLREKERQSWQRLLRVLSHEINNSLTPIASFSSGLLRRVEQGKLCDDDLRQGLEVIQERAASLHEFVRRYGQLSQLPAPHKQMFNWLKVLMDLMDLYPQVEWVNRLNHGDIPTDVYGDPKQLSQVFVNLIKNAVEACTSGEARLVFEAKPVQGCLEITLIDNGEGIANPDNVFVPFYTTKPGGSGIGLSLCRQIMLNHNGELTLQNNAGGAGAKAQVSIPMMI